LDYLGPEIVHRLVAISVPRTPVSSGLVVHKESGRVAKALAYRSCPWARRIQWNRTAIPGGDRGVSVDSTTCWSAEEFDAEQGFVAIAVLVDTVAVVLCLARVILHIHPVLRVFNMQIRPNDLDFARLEARTRTPACAHTHIRLVVDELEREAGRAQ
jgi:hypothetical protein